jgi:hypothetical protein
VYNASAGSARRHARFSGKSVQARLSNALTALRLGALSAVVAGLVAFGCGSTPASLEISAPSSVIAGSPFTLTVTAMVGGSRDRIFNSPIHFTSSDSAAVLPAVYTFTGADAGSHTFTNGVTLMTAGSQSITTSDINASSITATVNVPVSTATTATQFKASTPSTAIAVLKMQH